MRNKKKLIIIVSVIAALILSFGIYCFLNGWFSLPKKENIQGKPELVIKAVDVGDGNAIIVTLGDKIMLIDVGREENASDIKTAIKACKPDKIDILVITHAHYDHYGGVKAFGDYKVEKTYISPYVSESNGYDYALDYINERCYDVNKVKYGDGFSFGEAVIEVLGPVKDAYEEINDTSLILKITYGDVKILLPADAEGEEINDTIESGCDIKADVFFVSHHGSNADATNSYRFLNEVLPEYAVISCAGESSEYGYPHDEVLSRLSDLGCEIYRTDLNGDITITTDGKKIEIKTEK